MCEKEQETKLVTTLEVRYQGDVIFSHQFNCILNDADLVTKTDLRNLPICKTCGKRAVWYMDIKRGECDICRDASISYENAAVDQMYRIGYW